MHPRARHCSVFTADNGDKSANLRTRSNSRAFSFGSSPIGPIALVEVQGYTYAALRGMASLANRRGDDLASARWSETASSLAARVEQAFWQDDLQFYAIALDGKGSPCRVRASNVGHLLFSGLPSPERGRIVARHLLSGAFDSGWGVRTLPSNMARFNPMSYHNGSVWPHDVALCAAGVARYGNRDGAVHLLNNLFEAAAFFGLRLPELFCGFKRSPGESPTAYPVACLPQAWAAGSVFMLLQACLGVEIDAPADGMLINRPRLPVGIDSLNIGNISVGASRFDLAFRRVEGGVVAFVEPEGGALPTRVEVRL